MLFWFFLLSLFFCLVFLHGEQWILFSVFFFLLFMVGDSVVFLMKRKKGKIWTSFWKHLLQRSWCFLWGLIFSLSILSFHFRLKGELYFKSFWGTNQFLENQVSWETYQSFGTIIDTQKYHKYLLEDSKGNHFLFNTNQNYQLWDHVYLTASLKPRDNAKFFPSFTGTFYDTLVWSFEKFSSSEFWDYEFNYDLWLFMKDIDGTLYEQTTILIKTPEEMGTMHGEMSDFFSLGFLDNLRANLQQRITDIYWQTKYAGLLLWLLIWDKSYLPTDDYNLFVNSWLVHIIAVSWGNIAMVVILLSFLLKWLPFYVRNGVIILLVGCYACLCWSDASVIRATIMGILTLLVLFVGREISLWRSLKYACIGIILLSPLSCLYDVWFLLSFSAIIGIVLFQKAMLYVENHFKKTEQEKQIKPQKLSRIQRLKTKLSWFFPSFWKEYCIPTFWASLWTAPILLFFMNGVNLTGVLLNLFIIPLIPIITIYGFWSLLLYFLLPRSFWPQLEIFVMDFVFSASHLWSDYALFLQAKNNLAKYLFMVYALCLIVLSYRSFFVNKPWKTGNHQKNPQAKNSEPLFELYFNEKDEQ